MKDLQINTNLEVESIFNKYPSPVRQKMLVLRKMIIDTAKDSPEIHTIEETLKWGEPSYLTKIGSTIRIDWKSKSPDQYAVYFQCTSRLVETFKTIFKNTFQFDGKRAIVFKLNEEIPSEELSNCIRAALAYHKVKHLPTLGI